MELIVFIYLLLRIKYVLLVGRFGIAVDMSVLNLLMATNMLHIKAPKYHSFLTFGVLKHPGALNLPS